MLQVYIEQVRNAAMGVIGRDTGVSRAWHMRDALSPLLHGTRTCVPVPQVPESMRSRLFIG